MKKMMKMSAGALLGAMLCFAMLIAPSTAEAYYWDCGYAVVWCPDFASDGTNVYQNVGVWCNFPGPGQYTCWYA